MQAITAENKLLNYVSSVHLDGRAHEYQMKFSYVVDTLLEFGASEPTAVDTSGYYSDHSPTLASPTSMSPTRMIPTRLSPTLEPRREDPRNDESNLKLQMDQLKLERDQLRLENLKLEVWFIFICSNLNFKIGDSNPFPLRSSTEQAA